MTITAERLEELIDQLELEDLSYPIARDTIAALRAYRELTAAGKCSCRYCPVHGIEDATATTAAQEARSGEGDGKVAGQYGTGTASAQGIAAQIEAGGEPRRD